MILDCPKIRQSTRLIDIVRQEAIWFTSLGRIWELLKVVASDVAKQWLASLCLLSGWNVAYETVWLMFFVGIQGKILRRQLSVGYCHWLHSKSKPSRIQNPFYWRKSLNNLGINQSVSKLETQRECKRDFLLCGSVSWVPLSLGVAWEEVLLWPRCWSCGLTQQTSHLEASSCSSCGERCWGFL